MDHRVWKFAVVYGILMVVVEILLIMLGLRVPADNLVIASVLFLTVPPVAAWAAGFRRPRGLMSLWALVVPITAFLSVTFGTVQGLLAPLVLRPVAGLLASGATLALEQRLQGRGEGLAGVPRNVHEASGGIRGPGGPHSGEGPGVGGDGIPPRQHP